MNQEEKIRQIDQTIIDYYSKKAVSDSLVESILYSVQAGGKRIRPLLLLELVEAFGLPLQSAHFQVASALEMIHTGSLIHDDLPAMDDDDYRRGRLTNHKKFGEAMAILAGDSLFLDPYGLIAVAELPSQVKVNLIMELSQAVKGYNKMFENYTLGFPNREVEQGFFKFLLPNYASVSVSKSPYQIQCFVEEVMAGKVDDFFERLKTMFADIPYELARDREVHYQNILYIIFKLMGFYVQVEYRTNRGRIDLVLQTQDYVYIMEFKLNGSADEALAQIREKGYAAPFAKDSRTVYKIGVNFSDELRNIQEVKVEMGQ